jgi:hypothetical protein
METMKIGLASLISCFMLLQSLSLADTLIHTKITGDGYVFFNKTVNNQSVEIETDGPVEIESIVENGKMNVSVDAEGEGRAEVNLEGEYGVSVNEEKESGTGILSKVIEFIDGAVLKLTVLLGL